MEAATKKKQNGEIVNTLVGNWFNDKWIDVAKMIVKSKLSQNQINKYETEQ